MRDVFWAAKISNILKVLEVPDFFFFLGGGGGLGGGLNVDAGPEPMYGKNQSTPLPHGIGASLFKYPKLLLITTRD